MRLQGNITDPGLREQQGLNSICTFLLVTFLFLSPCLPSRAKEPIAENEQYRRVEFLEPHPQIYYVDSIWWETALPEELEGWLPARLGNPSGPEVQISHELVLKTETPIDETDLFQNHYVETARRIDDHFVILNAITPTHALETAQELGKAPGTIASYPIMRRAYRRCGKFAPIPNDTYFSQIWHVDNRNSRGERHGIDLNLRAAWNLTRGEDITIAVVDNGIDLEHPELVERASHGPHFNFGEDRASGAFINADAHGTAVAGLIAAEGQNETGVIGVAPQATLSSLVIFDINRRGEEVTVPVTDLMDMFQFQIDKIAVQNHSWGLFAPVQSSIDALSDRGIENAVKNGRGGKGVIIVRAGGNGREFLNNVNDEGWAQDPRAIAVGAVRSDGAPTSYSTRGACLLVSAPSGDTAFLGLATTDHQGESGYVSRGRNDLADYLLGAAGFSGTSASAPLITGVVALILSVNSDLTYRDVQQILIHSAFHPRVNDPDIEANGAGFVFSHNTGYGVPDAGFAVELAQVWKNRPEATETSQTKRPNRLIPDAGFQLKIRGRDIPTALRSIAAKPALGTFADEGTKDVPLVFVGEALSPIDIPLEGRGALIKRGTNTFAEKLRHAKEAGAEFAVIYNNRDADEIVLLGGTDFSGIPAVSINQNDGEDLVDLLGNQSDVTSEISLNSATVEFDISSTLICEHVGVELDTTHTYRGDLRITLLSPSGTRSVLQTINKDSSPGPRGWTYWSTKHFYESSAGMWKVFVTDQEENDIGFITAASLIIKGVPILDIDHDGLDDQWERRAFGSLNFGIKADPDNDGFNNAREQILQTPPTTPNRPFLIDFSLWDPQTIRLSWPSLPESHYEVLKRSLIDGSSQVVATLPGQFPGNELILPLNRSGNAFYSVRTRQ
ncbi:MAG: Calcium-dependent protease [Verrucomicrobia subdivision 3 bacterium]|nr:Calcium-dependent protease [Limisphaerales bacterium]MCS1413434.1 Calcium-dependent protease [Limisphaerales bacterium]